MACPVADLVRSTNVVARAPTGEDPEVVVTVAYDTSQDVPTDGRALGLFLELARALRVARPDHNVSFVALGAEHVDRGKGNLGSRRAAQELLDIEADPIVISLGSVVDDGCVTADGDELLKVPVVEGCSSPEVLPDEPDVFAIAGFDHVSLSGDPVAMGRMLLDFLSTYGS